jgi:hypothetical protein
MFYKHKHLLEELRKTGRPARGQVISMTHAGGGLFHAGAQQGDGGTWTDVQVHLRVIPHHHMDEPFEAHVSTRIHELKHQGETVPVWYDPTDHSRVVVDYEADLEKEMHGASGRHSGQASGFGDYQAHRDATADRLRHRHEQRLGLAWTPLAGELVPVAVTARPGTGYVSVGGQLSDLLADAARAAVSCVREHVAEIAPELPPHWLDRHDIHVEDPWGEVHVDESTHDGPSAALAIAVALVSLLTGHMLRPDAAVTGKIVPGGGLVPVGHLRSKVNVARRGGVGFLVAPEGHPDQHEAAGPHQDGQHQDGQHQDGQHQGPEVVFVSTIMEALHAALVRHPAKGFVPPA